MVIFATLGRVGGKASSGIAISIGYRIPGRAGNVRDDRLSVGLEPRHAPRNRVDSVLILKPILDRAV